MNQKYECNKWNYSNIKRKYSELSCNIGVRQSFLAMAENRVGIKEKIWQIQLTHTHTHTDPRWCQQQKNAISKMKVKW